ncbi:hypothetical protein DGo_PB0267 (plasmid) [Deinococcus gobiensis I-0]|uniref:Uncharacterized protein n=1 Tax=Deinococcus gobiensis (strain DSM 21396 / JCM 16679 / CGMCC 1.7299 / I-0) TaxID=745776 RepID=H8H1Y9_DEIGI|nr:hypothetical protein DGo_PB0267 [Deinococcus gobiensis I-0]
MRLYGLSLKTGKQTTHLDSFKMQGRLASIRQRQSGDCSPPVALPISEVGHSPQRAAVTSQDLATQL